jgi:hypothetical protein
MHGGSRRRREQRGEWRGEPAQVGSSCAWKGSGGRGTQACTSGEWGGESSEVGRREWRDGEARAITHEIKFEKFYLQTWNLLVLWDCIEVLVDWASSTELTGMIEGKGKWW